MPFGQPPSYRVGRIQRAIKRAVISYGVVSTRDLMEFAYPRSVPGWRRRGTWLYVRRVAARYLEPIAPRTRPLNWRAKPGVIPDE